MLKSSLPRERKDLAVSALRNLALKWKLFALTGLLLGLLTVQSLLALAGKPGHTVTIFVLGAGYVLGGGLALVIVVRMTAGFRRAVDRIDAVEEAAKGNLTWAAVSLAEFDDFSFLAIGRAQAETVHVDL